MIFEVQNHIKLCLFSSWGNIMKNKIFFRNSALHYFYILLLGGIFVLSVLGSLHECVTIFSDVENVVFSIIILLCGIFGIGLMGFGLIAMLRQVIVFENCEIFVPEQWGFSDEKYQYKQD